MAYKNQNYMTNRLIKETVDKNQKGYQEEAEPVEEPQTGNLTVTVKNIQDEVLEGAKVTLTDSQSNEYIVETDESGEGIIEDLALGEYLAFAEKEFYVSITKNITINKGENTLEMVFEEQEGTIGVGGSMIVEEEEEF